MKKVSSYRRLSAFSKWNEENGTNLILPMIDSKYWQKSLSLLQNLRLLLREYLCDCMQPGVYEKETKYLFNTTRSDPCCLMPKSVDFESWHVRYFKQFHIIPTLNNYLTILNAKIEKLQSAKEDVASSSSPPSATTTDYATRHQKISLFYQIKHEIIALLLCLTSTFSGCRILCEHDVDLFGLLCGLNKTLKQNKNAMDVDANSERQSESAQILSYFGTPRLSELIYDTDNNVLFIHLLHKLTQIKQKLFLF